MKFTKTNFTLKLNDSSSWIVYIAKTYEEASAKRFLEEIENEVDTNETMAEMWY